MLRAVVSVVEPPVARALDRLIRSPAYLDNVSRVLGTGYLLRSRLGEARDSVVRAAGLPSREDHVRLHGTLVRLEARAADLQDRLSRLETTLQR